MILMISEILCNIFHISVVKSEGLRSVAVRALVLMISIDWIRDRLFLSFVAGRLSGGCVY